MHKRTISDSSSGKKKVHDKKRFRADRQRTLFKKAWEFKTGLEHLDSEVHVGVLARIDGEWHVYLSEWDGWPVDPNSFPQAKLYDVNEFMLPAESAKWFSAKPQNDKTDDMVIDDSLLQPPQQTWNTTPVSSVDLGELFPAMNEFEQSNAMNEVPSENQHLQPAMTKPVQGTIAITHRSPLQHLEEPILASSSWRNDRKPRWSTSPLSWKQSRKSYTYTRKAMRYRHEEG